MPELQSIAQNDRSYRKGLLLGFTMAEIILLIIFALLLVLSTVLYKREAANKDLTKDLKSAEEKVEVLEAALKRAVGNDFGPDFVALVDAEKAAKQIAELKVQLEKAKEKSTELEQQVEANSELAEVLKESGIDPSNPEEVKGLADVVEMAASEAGFDPSAIQEMAANSNKLEDDNTNLKGQIEYLKKMCEDKGNGLECPPCWADANGKPEYIFDVALTSNGLIVHDRKLPHRQERQARLPLSKVEYDVEISPKKFADQFLPLLKWSKSREEECRFFVRVYDETAADEKAIYKQHMRILESRFYKYEVKNGTFPSKAITERANRYAEN